LAIAAN
jgi:hypothetical protein